MLIIFIHYIRQIPTYNEEWYFIANLENIIVMNQIHDTIDFSDISQACAQKENNYFCEMNSVTIHGATKISCSMQLILNSILRTGNFSQCLLEKL